MKKRLPYKAVFLSLCGALLAAIVISAMLGRYPITAKEVGGVMLSQFFDIEKFWKPIVESLLLQTRLPRIFLACLVGCSLCAAGASYQGVFQNPMASPDVLGASGGAAFGAALAILLGMTKGMIVAFAFGASLLCVGLVILVGNRTKGKRVVGLVLAGIMISSLFSSGTSYIKLVADPNDQLPAITYWLMGSLNGAMPSDVYFALIPMAIGLIPLLLLRWRINLLTLGEQEAKTMGIHTGRLRLVVIFCATLVTAAAVSVSGVIGWVGLVIPHLARRLVGNDYRKLLPTAMVMGALFLLLVDDVSRNALATEIPIGILTSLIGAPFFIYLMTKDGERV